MEKTKVLEDIIIKSSIWEKFTNEYSSSNSLEKPNSSFFLTLGFSQESKYILTYFQVPNHLCHYLQNDDIMTQKSDLNNNLANFEIKELSCLPAVNTTFNGVIISSNFLANNDLQNIITNVKKLFKLLDVSTNDEFFILSYNPDKKLPLHEQVRAYNNRVNH